ncbi:hypothetical protein MGG_17574 [Pyricularia oryzae 70-15]|uniref:Uncharacterized protein n=1 Tax=Pyricularia oryzae (strain 70-15 / ATCC MYA-4617 / FGSC 8958) TaxID=242507 RepID=G4NFQ3_PYRO7|nr:uncharacterized protein MGG_17574 [Pyricularia oryzae 70-15]EHA46860.1 hypothetical protein MGG_17574 [Pyricularia oryzae 70-15]
MGDTEWRLRDEEKSREAALLPGKRREERGDEVDVVSSESTLGWRTAVGGTSADATVGYKRSTDILGVWQGRAGQAGQTGIEAGKEKAGRRATAWSVRAQG